MPPPKCFDHSGFDLGPRSSSSLSCVYVFAMLLDSSLYKRQRILPYPLSLDLNMQLALVNKMWAEITVCQPRLGLKSHWCFCLLSHAVSIALEVQASLLVQGG